MGNIGDSISDSAPAVGTSGPGYATTINSLLTEIKARLIARIPLSSLLTNSDLEMNGQALLDVGHITLTDAASTPGASPVNRIEAYDGDVWWVSPSGAVQITSGAGLNAAAIGGITGDYDGDPMEFRYDIANTRYDAFADQSTNTWAYVRARGFDIAGGATSNFRARLAFGGVANATYTLPAAVPGSISLLQMDATGAITTSNSLPADTAIKHGNMTYTHGIVGAIATSGTLSPGVWLAGPPKVFNWEMSAAGTTVIPILGLRAGDRVTNIRIRGASGQAASATITVQDYDDAVTKAFTQTGAFNTTGDMSLAIDTPFTLVAGEQVFVEIAAGAATVNLVHYEVTLNRP